MSSFLRLVKFTGKQREIVQKKKLEVPSNWNTKNQKHVDENREREKNSNDRMFWIHFMKPTFFMLIFSLLWCSCWASAELRNGEKKISWNKRKKNVRDVSDCIFIGWMFVVYSGHEHIFYFARKAKLWHEAWLLSFLHMHIRMKEQKTKKLKILMKNCG